MSSILTYDYHLNWYKLRKGSIHYGYVLHQKVSFKMGPFSKHEHTHPGIFILEWPHPLGGGGGICRARGPIRHAIWSAIIWPPTPAHPLRCPTYPFTLSSGLTCAEAIQTSSLVLNHNLNTRSPMVMCHLGNLPFRVQEVRLRLQ